MDASIIVTCKGRQNHLAQTLPSILAQSVPDGVSWNVIIVDYGCPDGTFDWLVSLKHPRVMAIRVEADTGEFKLNHARNIGARAGNADFLCFLDADLVISSDTLARGLEACRLGAAVVNFFVHNSPRPLNPENSRYTHEPFAYRGPWNPEQTRDMACVSRMYDRRCFFKFRGFDEQFRGWGWDDVDLLCRVTSSPEAPPWPIWAVGANFEWLNHSDHDSTRFYAQTKAESSRRNFELMKDPSRPVNPQGFGNPGPGVRMLVPDYTWVNSEFLPPECNLGKWAECYRHASPFNYGTEATYLAGAEFLSRCETIEDWGCGAQWFRKVLGRYNSRGRVTGLDGSPPLCDKVVDLAEHTSRDNPPQGLFMRHVLEHDYRWRKILGNALESFTDRMALVLFMPTNDTGERNEFDHRFGWGGTVPNLSLHRPELEALLRTPGLRFESEQISHETIYRIQRTT